MTTPSFRQELEAALPQAFRFAYKLTRDADRARDLVHDVAVRALSREHLYEPGTKMASWLCTLTFNEFCNNRRRAGRGQESVDIGDIEVPVPGRQDAGLMVRDLRRGLDALTPEMRQTVLLRASGLGYDQIAEHLGIPLGTVRSRLSRGRTELRRLMPGY